MRLFWTAPARQDYRHWEERDPKIADLIDELLHDIEEKSWKRPPAILYYRRTTGFTQVRLISLSAKKSQREFLGSHPGSISPG